jgi:hypothetical protein
VQVSRRTLRVPDKVLRGKCPEGGLTTPALLFGTFVVGVARRRRVVLDAIPSSRPANGSNGKRIEVVKPGGESGLRFWE